MEKNYQVVDRQTGDKIGSPTTFKRAINKVDRLDNQYGGYRYGYDRIN